MMRNVVLVIVLLCSYATPQGQLRYEAEEVPTFFKWKEFLTAAD